MHQHRSRLILHPFVVWMAGMVIVLNSMWFVAPAQACGISFYEPPPRRARRVEALQVAQAQLSRGAYQVAYNRLIQTFGASLLDVRDVDDDDRLIERARMIVAKAMVRSNGQLRIARGRRYLAQGSAQLDWAQLALVTLHHDRVIHLPNEGVWGEQLLARSFGRARGYSVLAGLATSNGLHESAPWKALAREYHRRGDNAAEKRALAICQRRALTGFNCQA